MVRSFATILIKEYEEEEEDDDADNADEDSEVSDEEDVAEDSIVMMDTRVLSLSPLFV